MTALNTTTRHRTDTHAQLNPIIALEKDGRRRKKKVFGVWSSKAITEVTIVLCEHTTSIPTVSIGSASSRDISSVSAVSSEKSRADHWLDPATCLVCILFREISIYSLTTISPPSLCETLWHCDAARSKIIRKTTLASTLADCGIDMLCNVTVQRAITPTCYNFYLLMFRVSDILEL